MLIKVLAALFALLSAALSLTAAKRGRDAAQVIPRPRWTIEPGDSLQSLQGWNAALLEAAAKSGTLNSGAAVWAQSAALASVAAATTALFT